MIKSGKNPIETLCIVVAFLFFPIPMLLIWLAGGAFREITGQRGCR